MQSAISLYVGLGALYADGDNDGVVEVNLADVVGSRVCAAGGAFEHNQFRTFIVAIAV